ncbi:hypothetical protein N7E81_17075 [Reichenbachiella carrageenanivorans]|uniref:Uncharacterized protein n=1 Tax=Reichenbachiella carrageenanivorans TaxID=2979869 RepID=A0ABY6D053_9BACT|nr:hypothetical protein [Reichenbachiella carrageenanivorans]UXX79069.1 hypothetical protein N7E81_17075 [Reichenbachiella carrageenanivorans]
MRNLKIINVAAVAVALIVGAGTLFQCTNKTDAPARTEVTIKGEQFYINGELTYKGRYWNGHKIEGLLMNSRMVQGIYDDVNPESAGRFKYPDTGIWDPERNTAEFVAAMPEWKRHGLLAFTLNLQGGSPMGYGNLNSINSTFDSLGNLRPAYMARLTKVLDKADELGMVVILGYFYFGQDQVLADEMAVINGVDNITNWLLNKGYKNILVEIGNEVDYPKYEHSILTAERIHELVARVQGIEKDGYRLLTSTSYRGGRAPQSNVVEIADFLLIHGNKMEHPEDIYTLVEETRNVQGYTPKPILFNEDDHYDFDAESNNMVNAVKAYTSWGYFDFRKEGEAFENGFQTVPVSWEINSDRKKSFFNKVKEITGY